MAAKLVGTFLRCALGPVNYAGGCIISSRVADGLRELTPDSLFGGVRRGIDEAATQVGVKPADVERLLPMSEIRLSAERLGFCQKNALEAWNMHAGQIGGLLSGVAELTVDGRAPDVALCLDRLAKKVIRDKPLFEPLHALSLEVSRWDELIHLSASRLEDGGVLAKAYRKRRLQQIGAGVALLITASASLATVLWVRAGRARVEEALIAADPCLVATLAEGDRARGSLDQKRRIEERGKQCEEQRAAAERAREEQQKKEARVLEEARVKAERVAKCDALAAHVEAGAIEAGDAALAAGREALLGRIAAGKLDASDFGPESPTFPCEGMAGGKRIGEAFDKAVLAVPARWANADEPSDRVREGLERHAVELPASAKQVVARRADEAAKKALLIGGAAQVAKAVRLCKVKNAIGLAGGRACAGVLGGP